MTKDEFKPEFKRLCEGHKFEPTPQQFEAFYHELRLAHPKAWVLAVNRLLCETRFPTLEKMLAAIEKANEDVRTHLREIERRQADQWMRGQSIGQAGDRSTEGDSVRLEAYNRMRMELLVRSVASEEGVAKLHVEGLAAWFDDPENARMAQRQPMGDCGKHTGPHTLYACLKDELTYWMHRAEGLDEAEANRRITEREVA